jgi:hypothetical protein
MAGDGDTVLGSIIIDLVVAREGDLQVSARIEGTIQYVTAMGMLEMAKPMMGQIISEDED